MAAALRALCMETLAHFPIPGEAAEDLTHTMLPVLIDRIEQGLVACGSEDAYVRTTARNRARDYLRDQSGVRARASLSDDVDEVPAPHGNVEETLVAWDEARERAISIARIRYLITQAPAPYRQILEHVHVASRPIEELVVSELVRRGVDPGDPVERRRARAAIDKTLQRARAWVRGQL
jgi:DNA-directed RNA polymerase specialized sigma24 family protein